MPASSPPALRTGLPGPGLCVRVGPPLSARGSRRASRSSRLLPPVTKAPDVLPTRLKSTLAAPFRSGPDFCATLLLRMTLRRRMSDLLLSMPPPKPNPAVLNATVQFCKSSLDEEGARPAPRADAPALTALPEIVQLRKIASVRYRETPPP